MTTSLSAAERQARQNALMTEHGQLVRRFFERQAKGLPPQQEEEQRLQAVRQELDELDVPLIAELKAHWVRTFGVDLDAPDDGVTPGA